jgi:hypothetical protein
VRPLELTAILLTLLAHVIGAGVLIYFLLDGEGFDWHVLWPRDDDGRGGPGPDVDDPRDDRPDGGVLAPVPPLPDAAPSAVRLREPGRIAEGYPKPARRPEHAPERPRIPERG